MITDSNWNSREVKLSEIMIARALNSLNNRIHEMAPFMGLKKSILDFVGKPKESDGMSDLKEHGDDTKIVIKYIVCSMWNSLFRTRRIQLWAF
jgi:hypothetical protein